MANHRKKTSISLPSLNKRQWIRIGVVAAALALVATGGIVTRSFYASDGRSAAQQVTAFSATDPLTVSRGSARDGVRGMDGDTSYVTVKLDGQSRTVLGTDFTTVKSVLEAGNITLGPNDTVDPALDAEVDESTVITIETADSTLETSEEPIAFNTVRKETSSLPEGTEQVETEGEEGVMETTSLVTRAGDTVISSNVFASYVKKAPVDKVIWWAPVPPPPAARPAPPPASAPPCRPARCSSGHTTTCWPTATPRPISPPPCTSSTTSPAGE